MVRFAAAALALATGVLGTPAFGADIVLLDFWSPSCGPCMQMKPTVRNFTAAGYPIREVDVTRDPQLARQHNVGSIPESSPEMRRPPCFRPREAPGRGCK